MVGALPVLFPVEQLMTPFSVVTYVNISLSAVSSSGRDAHDMSGTSTLFFVGFEAYCSYKTRFNFKLDIYWDAVSFVFGWWSCDKPFLVGLHILLGTVLRIEYDAMFHNCTVGDLKWQAMCRTSWFTFWQSTRLTPTLSCSPGSCMLVLTTVEISVFCLAKNPKIFRGFHCIYNFGPTIMSNWKSIGGSNYYHGYCNTNIGRMPSSLELVVMSVHNRDRHSKDSNPHLGRLSSSRVHNVTFVPIWCCIHQAAEDERENRQVVAFVYWPEWYDFKVGFVILGSNRLVMQSLQC